LTDILDLAMVKEGWKQLASVVRIDRTVQEGAAAFTAISAVESTWYMRNMLFRDSG